MSDNEFINIDDVERTIKLDITSSGNDDDDKTYSTNETSDDDDDDDDVNNVDGSLNLNIINSDVNKMTRATIEIRKLRIRLYSVGIIAVCSSILLMLTASTWLASRAVESSWRDRADSFIPNIKSHLISLYQIGLDHNGSRTAGTGYNASSDYIMDHIDQTFYTKVWKQYFTISETKTIEPTKISSNTNENYKEREDFTTLRGPHGYFVGSSIRLSIVKNYGCDKKDYDTVIRGTITLVRRGNCTFEQKLIMSMNHFAQAVFVYNNNDNVTYGTAGDHTIPMFMIRKGLALKFMNNTPKHVFNINFNVRKTLYQTHNIIAEVIGTQYPDDVIVIGAHLDSVQAGPGINDNGSGSSTILETANRLAKEITFRTTVRFCWWAGEEEGLLGSTHYVNSLSKDELNRIIMNMNFDMLASPNYLRAIYDGRSSTDEKIHDGNVYIQTWFENYFNKSGLKTQLTPFDGRSDYGPFIENGISAGGLFSGAEQLKTEKDREEVDGVMNVAYDPCYHQYCDTFYNINWKALDELGTAVLEATRYFATLDNVREKLKQIN